MADPQQAVDYDALAQQHGGKEVIDYDALAAQHGGKVAQTSSKQSASSIGANPPWYSAAGLKSRAYQAADALTQLLPAAGGTAGGLLGASAGPAGAVGGAALGGAGGEAASQLLRRGLGFESPQTSGAAAKGIAKEGAIQGAVQGVTEGLPTAAAWLRGRAAKQYVKALAPTTLENKTIASQIAPEMIDRGVTGSTGSIEKQAGQNIERLRPQLESTYAGAAQGPVASQSPISKTISSLESMKAKYIVDGQVVNPKAWNGIEATQQVIEKHGNDISPQSLRKIKQIFDESVSEAGGYTTADLATNYELKAQREAANTIRDILHKANPEAAGLDKEMSFWLDVQQVARATNVRQTGQAGGLLKTLAPLGAGVAGASGLSMAGHSAEAGLGGAATVVLTDLAVRAVRSPAWRTTSAVVKDRFATALARGDVRTASAVAARLGIAGATATPLSQPAGPEAQPPQQ